MMACSKCSKPIEVIGSRLPAAVTCMDCRLVGGPKRKQPADQPARPPPAACLPALTQWRRRENTVDKPPLPRAARSCRL